ncbi:MAG: sensor histidine kinase efflux regulator BaeS [Pseudoxanthomonas sp.]
MRLGISAKLYFTVLIACALVLGVNVIAARLFFGRTFMDYLNDEGLARMLEVLPRVRDAYAQHGNWQFIRDNPDAWFVMMRPERVDAPRGPARPPISDQTGAVFRFAVLDRDYRVLVGNREADRTAILRPIQVDGQVVGWMAMLPFERALAAGDARFYARQSSAWWLIACGSVLLSALLAWPLSQALVRRVRSVAAATHRLAAGHYDHRLPPLGHDEVGRLAADVNQLADTLEHTERNRRGFMADISHELRTPLAVLRAELEAIQDGIRPMAPAALAPLQGEVQQLGKLVDDLHELALTQSGEVSYRFDALDLGEVLQASVAGMRGRFADAGLALRVALADEPLRAAGDERRLQQLFANLLENSLRYTDRGGEVAVGAQRRGERIEATLEDSAPGVAEPRRERLFERFYRVEASRNRASGGSGLGLAICRNIVQAHAGTIRAEASALGGLRIVVDLPALP